MFQLEQPPLILRLVRGLGAALLATAPFAVLGIATHSLQKSSCPEDTLVSGPLSAWLLLIGMFGLWLACVLLFGYGFEWRRRGRPFLTPGGARLLCVALAVPSSLAWVDSLYSYYCVRPATIDVHAGPLADVAEYSWSDVARLEVGCTHGKYTDTLFNLHLKDGRSLRLAGDSWSMTSAHYDSIIAALSRTSYVYDNQRLKGCPPEFWERFEKKPG